MKLFLKMHATNIIYLLLYLFIKYKFVSILQSKDEEKEANMAPCMTLQPPAHGWLNGTEPTWSCCTCDHKDCIKDFINSLCWPEHWVIIVTKKRNLENMSYTKDCLDGLLYKDIIK